MDNTANLILAYAVFLGLPLLYVIRLLVKQKYSRNQRRDGKKRMQ